MKSSVSKTIFAGFAGGVVLNLVMLLTFRLIGFGWDGDGILLDPSIQSGKLIAVWTQIEPIPLVVSNSPIIVIGLILFSIGHAFIYQWLAPNWPQGVVARAWRLAALVFFFSFLFFEFFTPFNMFGEPILLLFLELIFWATIAVAEALTIAAVLERE